MATAMSPRRSACCPARAANLKGAGNLKEAGNFQREYDGGNKLAVSFPGRKFSRRYMFFGSEVEPTRL